QGAQSARTTGERESSQASSQPRSTGESRPVDAQKSQVGPAEGGQQRQFEQSEVRTPSFREREKFRDELKKAVALKGGEAPREIARLLRDYRYEGNSEKLKQASNTWFFSRISRPAKVRFIRSLDLPESVILDFLSVELERQIGTRNGPRNRDDVLVRSAES